MKVTLGGDRLGSGQKNKLHLHNYERSTHNLSQSWASSVAPGVLYPFLVIPAMRGDKFDIDLDAAIRTIPTKGPLFGSFKLQLDVFQADVRLYQAFLHNNPLALGLKMSQVKLPKIEVTSVESDGKNMESSLLKYLGISNLGTTTEGEITRTFNAVPMLAYYDIFKNYYANKQEENAYVIGQSTLDEKLFIEKFGVEMFVSEVGYTANKWWKLALQPALLVNKIVAYTSVCEKNENINATWVWNTLRLALGTDNNVQVGVVTLASWYEDDNENIASVFETINVEYLEDEKRYKFSFLLDTDVVFSNVQIKTIGFTRGDSVESMNTGYVYDTYPQMSLIPFNLSLIDDMRMEILSYHNLGSSYMIGYNKNWDENGVGDGGLPYSQNFEVDAYDLTQNYQPMNGLVVKTYQSDIFNNWIKTDWIDGENGIAEITKVTTTNGAFKIDALNLAEKLYNMLNRIAVAGATYEDWQDAVYTDTPRRHSESPKYLGGMAKEVVFDEIVQSAPAGDGILGTLGGRGRLADGQKGGKIHVKCEEFCYIIGIVSITPRIYYTQGNEWYMTELDSINDMHKPSLDAIGFQDLMQEQMCGAVSGTSTPKRAGKIPAWSNYMTAVDKAYGDFANPDKAGFMILSRRYETTGLGDEKRIKDCTTYIDPSKFNYAFGYTDLTAQNFWLQIHSKVIARRLMSAKQIPNL